MPTVHVLAPEVIAKIAAGEVVERPSSVVKELLENSIDAGANTIEIHLKDAGKELIHIKDDGCGIPRDNLERLFQRHATSKITSIEDLERLMSMGFRGEALYSIAAVSDILLRSKTLGHDAWEINVRASKRLDLRPAAFPNSGTEIKITQLFFNTPARRKFLKSNVAETQQILNVVLPYALLYPAKRFLLTHDSKTLLDLAPQSSAIERMAMALGLESKHLIETAEDFADLNARVHLLLSDINVQRPRRDLQFIFINGRPVESKNLSFNINDIYRLILPPGVYPAFVLDITINPADVDVNIHPTKREVRIRQEARLVSFTRHLCEYTLLQHSNIKTVISVNDTSDSPQVYNNSSSFLAATPPQTSLEGRYDSGHWQSADVGDLFSTSIQGDLFKSGHSLKDKFGRARFIGSFINKFLIFEEERSLLLVDQHAAQERIMFERFERQLNEGALEIQPLLTPVLLKLSPAEKIAWEESNAAIAAIGIETTSFDDDTIAIQTQPTLLKDVGRALRVLLSGDDVARCDRTTIARRACKASIVSGDKLDASQADYQRKQLLACHDPFTCPHGRPTVIEITASFLDKQFLRT